MNTFTRNWLRIQNRFAVTAQRNRCKQPSGERTALCNIEAEERKASMQNRIPRREFLSGLGMIAAATSLPCIPGCASMDPPMKSPFRIAVINDEITQDFGRACEIASKEFGMEWIELRGMWNKNLLKLDAKEIEEAHRILEKYQLRVADIASPLFKVDWPGAPKSKFSPKRDQFNADFTFEQQDEVLERSLALAKTFKTDRVRFFDFWRLDDQAPYRAAINEKLRNAAEKAAKKDGSGYQWAAMGGGIIDWVGQFKALKRDGYHFAVSLETHWRGGGTPEESTRQSWAGMKKELQEAGTIS